MTAPLTVAFERAAQDSGAIAQVVAALPVSLLRSAERGELVGIDGSPGWPAAAEDAIDAGAVGVVIVRPVPADVASLIAKANAKRVPIVIDAMWTYNPAVATSLAPFDEVADDRALLEARVYAAVGSDWQRVLLDQFSLVRAAVSPIQSLDVIRRDETGYSASALLANGGRAIVTGIRTASVPQSATLRIVKPQRMVELKVPAPETAVPGTVVVTSLDGSNLLETSWETAHRVAWRTLHGLVLAGSQSSDLENFSQDQATATA